MRKFPRLLAIAVNGAVIKTRAAALRAAGDAQVAKHLAAQLGRPHHILMENPQMGRTEQFTEVTFETAQPVGQIIPAKITGHTTTQLIATPMSGR